MAFEAANRFLVGLAVLALLGDIERGLGIGHPRRHREHVERVVELTVPAGIETVPVGPRASGEGSIVAPLLLFSGFRASEVLGLTWSEIDFADQVIRVRYQMSRTGERVPVKTDAGRREVILMDELAHALRKRRPAARFSQHDDLVLGNGLGNTLGYTRLLRAFSDAAEPRSCAL